MSRFRVEYDETGLWLMRDGVAESQLHPENATELELFEELSQAFHAEVKSRAEILYHMSRAEEAESALAKAQAEVNRMQADVVGTGIELWREYTATPPAERHESVERILAQFAEIEDHGRRKALEEAKVAVAFALSPRSDDVGPALRAISALAARLEEEKSANARSGNLHNTGALSAQQEVG